MQIYDDEKRRVGVVEGFKNRSVTKTLSSGDKTLVFDYPANGDKVALLKAEYYIRTKDDEYVIKQIEYKGDFNRYTAVLNVEDLEDGGFPYGFASKEQTIRACLEFAFKGTGWKVGICTITKKRTIDIDDSATAWDVLQECLKTYRVECLIHTLTKTIDIYEQIGQDRGAYIMAGLNLRKLTLKEDTYDFYTRIHPFGKDGIEITWLNGKHYLENYQYSDKVKTYVWKDERYTNTTSLIEDAQAKLEEMSRPYKAYTADVLDLARASEDFADILDYGIGDTVTLISKSMGVKEKMRIVKIVEYDDSEKNTAELSSARLTFAQIQQEETAAAKEEAVDIANRATKKTLEDYSTTEEIETKITASKEEIELGVMHTLESYYDKTETDALIELSKGEIELSVSQTYQTKAAMGDYSTTKETQSLIDIAIDGIELAVSEAYETKSEASQMEARIKVTTDSITSEVNKKVNNSEFGTKISQNAYYVRVAWNGNSNYVQFENGGITVYDGSVEENKKRAIFNYSGSHFYRDGYYVGKIGTNEWQSNSAHKGLVFDLDVQGKYMTFAQKPDESSGAYYTMMCFSREGSIYDTYGIHMGCDIDMHGYKIKNANWDPAGLTNTIHYVQILEVDDHGEVTKWGPNGKMTFTNGILTELTYYG